MKLKKIVTYLLLLVLCFFAFGNTASSRISGLEAISTTPSRINMMYYDGKANSRGFNFVTNNAVDTAQVEIIEKKEGMTNSNLNWENAQIAEATSNDFYVGYRSWKASITNLNWNSSYFYRITTNVSTSKTYEFEVTDGKASYTFMHVADPQGYSPEEYAKFSNTLDVANKEVGEVDNYVCTGDFSQSYKYPDVNVKEWGYCLDSVSKYFTSHTLTAAAGNHDLVEGMFTNHFNAQIAEGTTTTDGYYYSYTVNDIHVLVLNTNDGLTSTTSLSENQMAFIENDLKNNTATWTIMVMHKGPYTTGRHVGDSDINKLRTDLLPIISKYRVDLVLQGHDHVYARTEPYAWDSDGITAAPKYEKETKIINNTEYQFAINPEGTYYSIPNTSTAHAANLAQVAAREDLPNYFKITNSPVNNMFMSEQNNLPMFSYVTIENGTLLYRAYYIDEKNHAQLYDYFGIRKNTACEAERLISLLPNKYTSSMKYDLGKAYTYFQNLPESELQKLSNESITKIQGYSKYTSESAYVEAQKVIQMIQYLEPARADEAYLSKLQAIEEAYNRLSNIGKTFVSNYTKYQESKKLYETKCKVEEIDLLLGELTEDSDLASARALYDQLSIEEKYYITNYFKLLYLETKTEIIDKQY